MKITFLGTSHGVPSAERHCSCTMLEVGGAVYFIDAGAPLIDLLLRRGMTVDNVRTIFTTHFHSDHTDGILSFAGLVSWYYKTAAVDVYLTEQRGINAFKEMITASCGALDEQRVRFKHMTAETVYEDEFIRVTPLPTQHLAGQNRPAYSYLIEAEGKKILFSGDLSVHLAAGDFPSYTLEHEVDLMVCEMAHFSIDEVAPYLERCKAKRLLVNHVHPVSKLEQIDALNGRFGYPIRTVADGDAITLS